MKHVKNFTYYKKALDDVDPWMANKINNQTDNSEPEPEPELDYQSTEQKLS